MTTLFSYCIPYDDGAAPNPFWGTLSLAICKPKIRLAAQVGDWVVGTGSRNSPMGDIAGHVVYAMRVTEKLPMEAYDALSRRTLRGKVPVLTSKDPRQWVGDSIYAFSAGKRPMQRSGVHTEGNRSRDLSGTYVLLSTHFFYFGDKPVPLPSGLLPIVNQGQGHKSSANAPYVARFVRWVESLGYTPGTLVGLPQGWIRYRSEGLRRVCSGRVVETDVLPRATVARLSKCAT